MNKSPALSVILPVYNTERYLREAVDSILTQTFTDFELILIDDGSTDRSGDICREYAGRDPRIVLIDRPNGGLVSALNEGIAKARAPLIARMDADDIAMPERFACQYAHMMKNPQIAVLGSAIRWIDETGQITGLGLYPLIPAESKDALKRGCSVAHPAVIMRKSAVLKAGGYRTAFIYAEDYDLWLRLVEQGHDISNLPQPLLKYRGHGANVSKVHQEKQVIATVLARLSYEVRQAGHPDPLAGVETLHAGLVQEFPDHLRSQAEAMLFTKRHINRSHIQTKEETVQAWQDYQQLAPQVQRDPLLCDFLMALLKRAVRQGSWGTARAALCEAFRRHPKRAVWIMWQRSRGQKI